MKYCVYCGHQIDDEARFCPSCGKPLNQPSSAPAEKKEEDGAAIASMVLGICSISLNFFSLFFLFFLPFLCFVAAIVGLCLSGRRKIYKGGPFGLTGFITSLVGLFVSLIAIIIVIAALSA